MEAESVGGDVTSSALETVSKQFPESPHGSDDGLGPLDDAGSEVGSVGGDVGSGDPDDVGLSDPSDDGGFDEGSSDEGSVEGDV